MSFTVPYHLFILVTYINFSFDWMLYINFLNFFSSISICCHLISSHRHLQWPSVWGHIVLLQDTPMFFIFFSVWKWYLSCLVSALIPLDSLMSRVEGKGTWWEILHQPFLAGRFCRLEEGCVLVPASVWHRSSSHCLTYPARIPTGHKCILVWRLRFFLYGGWSPSEVRAWDMEVEPLFWSLPWENSVLMDVGCLQPGQHFPGDLSSAVLQCWVYNKFMLQAKDPQGIWKVKRDQRWWGRS